VNRFTAPVRHDQKASGQFAFTYGTIDRIWCLACDKHENVPNLANTTAERMQAEHVCGPRTSPWASRAS